ncbi:hypothetical protein Q7A53_05680 [Halobacillus rhizosphaerae]|uniref:hypothetical protein n=1 Tax=Halobacillus rhizosphaerae TaxID=3064889 RepID=UPI00398AAE95
MLIQYGKAFKELKEVIQEVDGNEKMSVDEILHLMDQISKEEHENRISGEEVAKEFSDFINSSMTSERDIFAKTVTEDHAVIQMDAWYTFYKCLEIWRENYIKDTIKDRTESICKSSRIMVESLVD